MLNIFSVTFFCVLLWNEYRWYKMKKNWIKGKGKVVGFRREISSKNGNHEHPVVEWEYAGEVRRFTSEYQIRQYTIGQEVDILFTHDGIKGEIYSLANRWGVSVASILVCMLSIFIAMTP